MGICYVLLPVFNFQAKGSGEPTEFLASWRQWVE